MVDPDTIKLLILCGWVVFAVVVLLYVRRRFGVTWLTKR